MSHHLVVDLSSHGFGHAGITCPVLNALRPHARNIKVTIRTAVPAALIAQRVDFDFDYIAKPDFGMVMAGTMSVLPDESYAAYKELHKDWEVHVAAATAELAALKPSLLLSNISYLSIAAARKAGIPAVAFGAVNWADIFRRYCGNFPQAQSILEQMTDAYAGAEIFLQPIPAMPMPSIRRHRLVGPVAEIGRDRRAELSERLNLDPDRRLVLLALGGIPTRLSFDAWPRLGETCVITDSQLQANHPDVVSCERIGVSVRRLGPVLRCHYYQARLRNGRRGGVQWNPDLACTARRLAGDARFHRVARNERPRGPPRGGGTAQRRYPGEIAGGLRDAGSPASRAEWRCRGCRRNHQPLAVRLAVIRYVTGFSLPRM